MSGESPRVALCVPAGDHVATFWAYDWARNMATTAYRRPDIKQYPIMCTGSLVMKQRQTLVNTVLETTDATHIWFTDSDMRMPRDTLLRLLGHEAPVVCASYTERNAPFRPVAFNDLRNFEDRAYVTNESHGLKQIAAVGFGCILIETEVFRKMKKPHFMVGYNPEQGTFVGEDIYWCIQLQQMGIPLMLDLDLTQEVGHIGRFEFTADHANKAKAGRDAAEKQGDGTGAGVGDNKLSSGVVAV